MSDIQNNTEKLKSLLRKIKYPKTLSLEEMTDNNPSIFLQIVHHTLIDYSQEFYKSLLNKNYELFSKNDLRFVEQVYKLLIKEFNYKPSITISQFLSESYLEHKVIMINDIISTVLSKCNLKPKSNNKENTQNQNNMIKWDQDDDEEEDINPQQQPQPIKMIENTKDIRRFKSQNQPQSHNQLDSYLPQPDLQNQWSFQPNQPTQYEQQQTKHIPTQQEYQNSQSLPIQQESKQRSQQYQEQKPQQQYQEQKNQQQYQEQKPQQQQQYQEQKPQQQQQQQQYQEQKPQQQQQQQQYQEQKPQQQQQQYQESKQQYQEQKPQQQQQQQYQEQKPQQSQQFVTQQELNKVLQLVAVSNQNIQSVMKKLDEFQQTVNYSLQGLNARMILLENRLGKQL